MLEATANLLSQAVSDQREAESSDFNVINTCTRPTHTGRVLGLEFLTSIAGCGKNLHARFQVHSCYGSRDLSILKR